MLISITEELRNKKKSKETDKNKKKSFDWSETHMVETWTQFAQQLQQDKKINLYNIFSRHHPKKDNNNIFLTVVSLSEKSAIEEVKGDFLIFIKNKLQNDFITFSIDVKQHETKNMLYTKEEKYQYILEKNEKIQLLKDKLDLSIT